MDFSKIIKKLEAIPVEELRVVQYNFNVKALHFRSIAEYETVSKLLRRFNVFIDYDSLIYPDSYHINVYRIFNVVDRKHLEICENNVSELSDIFWRALRTGITQKEAKAKARKYAEKYDMTEAYNRIWAN